MDQYGRGPDWQQPDMYFGSDGGAAPGGYPQDPDPSMAGNSTAYQRYTEKPGPGPIDPETGIAPRRLTDCVCAVIFVLYVLGMIILIIVVKNKTVNGYRYSDVRRLTRGMDYQARLCGVDEGVEDKPYLFWCRNNPAEWAAPSSLDLWNPSCVKECPNINGSHSPVACLYPEQKYICSSEDGAKCKIPGGQFGNVINFHVQSQQSIVYTNPYNTWPVGGRYCMPVNKTLRETILTGPLNAGVRAFGSFQDCWGVLFLSVMFTVAFSYFYVIMMNECAKFLVYGFLGTALTAFGVSGTFLLVTALPFPEVRNLNPLFNTHTELEAMVMTLGMGTFLVTTTCAISGTITHVAQYWGVIRELMKASTECFMAMRSMLVPPLLEALWKFFLAWILMSNFLSLVSVGWYDDHRTEIDGQRFKGLNARFYFDWSLYPWIIFYIYGAVWIMELCTAFGQFLVAFSVISWYFMKKEGSAKTGVPPLPPLHGTMDGIVYHFGSLCLGAAIVPWVRPIRIFNWILDESFPSAKAECCGPLAFLTGLCQCLGKSFGACSDTCRSHLTPTCCQRKGLAYKYTKNVYSDIIIRSQHFLPGSDRSSIIINNAKSCQKYMMCLTIITVIGVITVGSLSAVMTYIVILRTPSLSHPTSSTFITSPMAVSLFAFWLSGTITYGFTMLFDHTADTLLYCYAWNKKFNKDTVDFFVPESIGNLVAHLIEASDAYQYFGSARPEMYLASWMPKTYRETVNNRNSQRKQNKQQAQQSMQSQQMSAQMSSQRMQDPSFTGNPDDPGGQYVNMGYATPDQQEPEGGYYFGNPMYSGGGYDSSGRYVGAG
uniref:Uncharacterized protein n=1 Tax=Alexandrium catenella TaxID=2925 RepID=A0A7S1SBE7_ALECA